MNKHVISMLMVLGVATSMNAANSWQDTAQRIGFGTAVPLAASAICAEKALHKLAHNKFAFSVKGVTDTLSASWDTTKNTFNSKDTFKRSAVGYVAAICAIRLGYIGFKAAQEEWKKAKLKVQSPIAKQ